MTISKTLGVIGGGGWLGGAIVGSILAAGLVRPGQLVLSYRRARPDRFEGAFWTRDSQELAARSDIIVVSVRPEDWPALDIDAAGKLVISVMAGIGLVDIAGRLGTDRVIRTLPNAAAEVGKSYTPWIASGGATAQDRAIVRAIFDACGTQDEVPSERDLDYLSGFSGTGPAYPALLAAAMMRDAIAFGLPADVARRAVNAIFVGTGKLVERDDALPADTIEAFLAYRGVTAAGIETMRASGFDDAVARGLRAAFDKAVAMGGG